MSEKKLIRYKLDEDTFITVESDIQEDLDDSSHELISKNEENEVYEINQRFEDAIAALGPVSNKLLDVLKDVSKPEEIQLEMGVKLSAKAGIILASADTEGAIKVTLKWKNDNSKTASSSIE